MRYCRECVQPDTRPGVKFDENGICLACVITKQRENSVNWQRRKAELNGIIREAKEKAITWDCVVAVSGGKDTTFQALYARDQLGLNCLLVNCAPDNISAPGRKNIENLVQKGFDLITIRPNPIVERALSRRAFFEFGNFVKPLEYPLYASSFRVALNYKIPLVVAGENPLEILGVSDYFTLSGDAMQWRNAQTVAGGDASVWAKDGVKKEDLFFYQFPDEKDLKSSGMKAIFLGYYVKEWTNHNNTVFSVGRGLAGRDNHDPLATGRTNKYFSLDADLKIINQNILKYYKFGFGAVTDEVMYDIRQGLITREEGIRLVQRYDGKCSDLYVQQWCDYIGITLSEFWTNIDKWVNRKLFWKDDKGNWSPKFSVG